MSTSTGSSNPETLADYVASQDVLVKEAAEALPHQFSQCTYPLGHLRFPKRNFRCDCPTESIAHACSLHATLERSNESNEYGQNFQALFCRCKRPYDAATEKETMIQCLACEDWFHESCCNLRERPNSEYLPPENQDQNPNGDAASDASNELPPALIGPGDYDAFVCGNCVLQMPLLQKYAGTHGCLIVTRDKPSCPWKVSQDLYTDLTDSQEVSESSTRAAGQKRALSPTAIVSDNTVKRARLSPVSTPYTVECSAPTSNSTIQKIFVDLASMTDPSFALSTGDIFLSESFRERWCQCPSCLLELEAHPYLSKEEETYEPPEDPDSALTLEELGMRALSRLPRERAIDGIQAFNAMRDDLVQYLRPFAQEGKVVNEADVRNFFDRLSEEKRASREYQVD
ncbi:hypothetical protein HHX47_DHR10000095 [Lentinula edodes]|nr:hypothetical protein HHX47_DHR10000095 [Lentinula edodes]